MMMKQFIILITAILGLSIETQGKISIPNELYHTLSLKKQGISWPNLEFTDAKGKKKPLEKYKGKLVLLAFMSSDCAPCITEIPTLEGLVSKFKGWFSSDSKVNVVAIFLDAQKHEDLIEIQKKFNIKNLKLRLDENMEVTKNLGVRHTPTCVLLDENGKEIWRVSGAADWSSKEIINHFEEILNSGE